MIPYPKIPTIFERDRKTKKVTDVFSSPIFEYLKDNIWLAEEKIDGTNIRIQWQNGSVMKIAGRTENAQLPVPLVNYLNDQQLEHKLRNYFGFVDVCLYGEGFGGNIQKVGPQYGPIEFALFDIRIGELWLDREDVAEIAQKLGLRTPPYWRLTLGEAAERVKKGFNSIFGTAPAEGLILRPAHRLLDHQVNRIIGKMKTRDW